MSRSCKLTVNSRQLMVSKFFNELSTGNYLLTTTAGDCVC